MRLAVTGPHAVTWHLVAGGGQWEFRSESGTRVVAGLSMTTDQAWRLLTNNLTPDEAAGLGTSGDPRILEVILGTRGIIGSPK